MVCSITPERGSSREPPSWSFRSYFTPFQERRIESESIIVTSILMQERVKVKILEYIRCAHSGISEVHGHAKLYYCQLRIFLLEDEIRTMVVSSILNVFCVGSGCGAAMGGAGTAIEAGWPFVVFCPPPFWPFCLKL